MPNETVAQEATSPDLRTCHWIGGRGNRFCRKTFTLEEYICGKLNPSGWLNPDYDDSGWNAARKDGGAKTHV